MKYVNLVLLVLLLKPKVPNSHLKELKEGYKCIVSKRKDNEEMRYLIIDKKNNIIKEHTNLDRYFIVG